MAKEHPDFPRLLEAMKVVAGRARPWAGNIFRSAPPKWATGKEMLTGVGSMKSGARLNAPGSFPAIYGSTTPELAMIESLAYQRPPIFRWSGQCRWCSRPFRSMSSGVWT